jgi:thiol-disulfide isomerase/thioredoxin
MFSRSLYKMCKVYAGLSLSICLILFCLSFQTLNAANVQETQNTKESGTKTVQVMLKLEGKTVEGSPKVVSADDTCAALYEKVQDEESLKLKRTDDNIWLCEAVEGKKYVIGWIVKKSLFEKQSKMFGYISEPFTTSEGLIVKFSPGMPATFEYDLRNPPEGVKATPAEVFLLKETTNNDTKSFLSWGGNKKIKNNGILTISGLAAGKYRLSARTSDVSEAGIPVINEDREVEIKSGSTNRFEPNYPVIDSTVEEGDVTVKGTVYGADKKPLAKKVVKVIPLGKNGFDRSLYYPITKTDFNGRFEFTGIRPNSMVQIFSEHESIFLNTMSLAKGAVVSADIVVGLKPISVISGQPMPEINLDFKGTGARKLSDLTGKIIVADVWATWCAPCIKALPYLNSLAGDFAKNEDIVFITISIDSDRDIWEKVIAESGWNSFKHSWFDEKANTHFFDYPIPYTFIVDKNGIVRAEGNGLNVKLELEKIILSSN